MAVKILIINDDGIGCEGIAILARFAKTLGDVTVVAPTVGQSGKSHAIELENPFEVTPIAYMDGVEAYTVSSTPADCVRYAFAEMGHYDLVFSGINRGLNIGADVVYSGTAGAVIEAALSGAKGVAFSTDPSTYADAERDLPKTWQFIAEHDLLSVADVLNVNIPLNSKDIYITRQGCAYYKDHFPRNEQGLVFADGYSAFVDNGDYTTDSVAAMNGYTTVTPLTTDRTDRTAYEKLKGLTENKGTK